MPLRGLRLSFNVGVGFGYWLRLVSWVRVGGWIMHYLYGSPHKYRSMYKRCVCAIVCVKCKFCHSRKGQGFFSIKQLNYSLPVLWLIILPSFLCLLLSHHALNVRSALWNSYLIRASTSWSTSPLLFLGISWGLVSHTKLMSSTWKRHFQPDLPF